MIRNKIFEIWELIRWISSEISGDFLKHTSVDIWQIHPLAFKNNFLYENYIFLGYSAHTHINTYSTQKVGLTSVYGLAASSNLDVLNARNKEAQTKVKASFDVHQRVKLDESIYKLRLWVYFWLSSTTGFA